MAWGGAALDVRGIQDCNADKLLWMMKQHLRGIPSPLPVRGDDRNESPVLQHVDTLSNPSLSLGALC